MALKFFLLFIPAPYAPCENKYDQCVDWKKSGMCEQDNYRDYLASICPVECGYCRRRLFLYDSCLFAMML